MNTDQIKKMYELFEAAREGVLTDKQFTDLDRMLARDKRVCKFYVEYLNMCSALKSGHAIKEVYPETKQIDDSLCDMKFWQEMSEFEKKAPKIEIPKEKPKRELVQEVVYPTKDKRKLSTFSKVFLALNAAAVLFLVLFLKFAPSQRGVEVATLTDSIDAKWADVSGSMEKGTRLATRSDKLFLREGLAEVLFDNHAKVVIEGPAEFELLSEDQINLRYGRIYATVPHEAVGFTINTSTSRVIDLGTEFGVQADAFGDVQLHVIKGKTTLIAGDRSNRINVEVSQGQAKKVSGTTLEVSDIPLKTELYTRDINSSRKIVWRGQTELDLADIVGGGNGLGTGKLDYGINMSTGQVSKEPLAIQGNVYTSSSGFHRVNEIEGIDSVFVPDSSNGPVYISSENHIFTDCPDTSSLSPVPIINGAMSKGYLDKRPERRKVFSEGRLVFENQMQGTKDNPCIFMHANSGITFDLAKIQLPADGMRVSSFHTRIGVPDNQIQKTFADVWVLIDGQVRFSKMMATTGDAFEVDIPLTANDRFLTLVVTDGVTETAMNPLGRQDLDWCLFMKPTLTLGEVGRN